MTIPKNILRRIKKLRQYGDGPEIAELMGYKRSDKLRKIAGSVREAVSSGECSEELFNAMVKYYATKNKKNKAIEEKLIKSLS